MAHLSEHAASPREDPQLDLSPAMHWQKKGARARKLLAQAIAANHLTFEFLSRETGIDESHISRSLRPDGGAHPPLALVMCVMWHDRAGVLIQGLAEMVGYEARPNVDPWERIRKLEAKITRLEAALAEEP